MVRPLRSAFVKMIAGTTAARSIRPRARTQYSEPISCSRPPPCDCFHSADGTSPTHTLRARPLFGNCGAQSVNPLLHWCIAGAIILFDLALSTVWLFVVERLKYLSMVRPRKECHHRGGAESERGVSHAGGR